MIDKIALIKTEIKRLKNGIFSGTYDARYALDLIANFINSLPEEPVSKVYTFKSIPRLLDMIQPSDRAKTYIAKLADSLDGQGYHSDANIVRESIKIMNGEKVAMATMDEEPVSDELEEAAMMHYKDVMEYEAKTRLKPAYMTSFKAGAKWQKEKLIRWLKSEADYLLGELKKGNKAYGLTEQYRAQLYKEIVNKMMDD